MDGGGKKHLTTQDAKARIMSTQAKQHGGQIKREALQLGLRVQLTRMNHHNRSDWTRTLVPKQLTERLHGIIV